jgi:hypothetical protein
MAAWQHEVSSLAAWQHGSMKLAAVKGVFSDTLNQCSNYTDRKTLISPYGFRVHSSNLNHNKIHNFYFLLWNYH